MRTMRTTSGTTSLNPLPPFIPNPLIHLVHYRLQPQALQALTLPQSLIHLERYRLQLQVAMLKFCHLVALVLCCQCRDAMVSSHPLSTLACHTAGGSNGTE